MGRLQAEAPEQSRPWRRWSKKLRWNWAGRGGGGGLDRKFYCVWIPESQTELPVAVSVRVAGERESAGFWMLVFWKETSFRSNPCRKGDGGGGGMKYYSLEGQQHSHASSVSPPGPPSLSPGPSLSSDTKMEQLWPQIQLVYSSLFVCLPHLVPCVSRLPCGECPPCSSRSTCRSNRIVGGES